MKGGILGGDPHHCMRSSLPTGPAELEDVEASLVTNLERERELVVKSDLTGLTHLGPDAVCALSHGVAVEGQFIIIFYKYIQ